jgi:hypothetical protein
MDMAAPLETQDGHVGQWWWSQLEIQDGHGRPARRPSGCRAALKTEGERGATGALGGQAHPHWRLSPAPMRQRSPAPMEVAQSGDGPGCLRPSLVAGARSWHSRTRSCDRWG